MGGGIMPACLHPRLLSICRQCYVPAGFDAASIGWAAGDPGPCGSKVDSALVGRVGDAIVVAYRGTLAPDGPDIRAIIDDWVNNAETLRREWPGHGDVHDGFLDSHIALWPHVEQEIARRIAAAAPKAIVVTGHSKGGALAVIGATAIRGRFPDIPVHVVTFAGPRAGGRSFADAYGRLGIPTLRYENRADLVPYLPLGDTAQPIVRALLDRLDRVLDRRGLKRRATGYVAVGNSLIAGPNWAVVAFDWAGVGFRMFQTRSLRDVGVPLIEAHRIDLGVYTEMVAGQAQHCAGQRHAECRAALGD
jgi:lipase (class 3)